MSSWLINPEDEEDEAVLFNAEDDDSLDDYEENPRRRRKAGRRRRRKSKKAKGTRRRRKSRKSKGTRRRRKSAGRPKKSHRKRRASRKSFTGFEENPKRKRRARRYRRNTWFNHARRHAKASKKGWRRRRRSSRRYDENPKRRRVHRRRAHSWKLNPFKAAPTFMKLPTWSEVKGKPMHAVGFALLGAIDTGLIKIGIDKAMSQFDATRGLPEPVRDIVPIIGSFAAGTAISWGINKFAKNNFYARCHQFGVYSTTILNCVGLGVKYIMRAVNAKKYKVTKPLKMPANLGPKQFAAEMFGLGGILGAYEEYKLVEAMESGGLVVAQDGEGNVGLANQAGDIIVSGPAAVMGEVVDGVSGIALADDGMNSDDSGTYGQDAGYDGFGEDITVES
jgi:hypothetical protein